jgi:hypothetical protein
MISESTWEAIIAETTPFTPSQGFGTRWATPAQIVEKYPNALELDAEGHARVKPKEITRRFSVAGPCIVLGEIIDETPQLF